VPPALRTSTNRRCAEAPMAGHSQEGIPPDAGKKRD